MPIILEAITYQKHWNRHYVFVYIIFDVFFHIKHDKANVQFQWILVHKNQITIFVENLANCAASSTFKSFPLFDEYAIEPKKHFVKKKPINILQFFLA